MDHLHPDVMNRPVSTSKWAERFLIGTMVIAPGLCFKVSMKRIAAFEAVALAAIGAQRLYLRTPAGFTRSLEWEADNLYGDFHKVEAAHGRLDNQPTYWPDLMRGVEGDVEAFLNGAGTQGGVRANAMMEGREFWGAAPNLGRLMSLDARYGAALILFNRHVEKKKNARDSLFIWDNYSCTLRGTIAFYLGLYENPSRAGSLSEKLQVLKSDSSEQSQLLSILEIKQVMWPA